MLRRLIRGGLLSAWSFDSSRKCVKSHWRSPTFYPTSKTSLSRKVWDITFLFFSCWKRGELPLVDTWYRWSSAMLSSCFADFSVEFILVQEDPRISSTSRPDRFWLSSRRAQRWKENPLHLMRSDTQQMGSLGREGLLGIPPPLANVQGGGVTLCTNNGFVHLYTWISPSMHYVNHHNIIIISS